MGARSTASASGEREWLTLKQMVEGASTTARAVRFYEAEKLLSAATRSRGGHRLFDKQELDKLRLVIDLRTCGFSIDEIREVLEAKARGASMRDAAQHVQELLRRHVQELKRKITIIDRLDREFSASVKVLERCANCTDPRGPVACSTCEVPRLELVPPSFAQIWAVPPAERSNDEAGGRTARLSRSGR